MEEYKINDKMGCLTIIDIKNNSFICKCKCGKISSFNKETLDSNPKYCKYPVFISNTMTYNVKANNATYRKKQKYKNLKNVVIVHDKKSCLPNENYCELWNQYKQKAKQKKHKKLIEYSIYQHENNKRKEIAKIKSDSHLGALKQLFPNEEFELVVQSDIRKNSILWGKTRTYDYIVDNNLGTSTTRKIIHYKKSKDSD